MERAPPPQGQGRSGRSAEQGAQKGRGLAALSKLTYSHRPLHNLHKAQGVVEPRRGGRGGPDLALPDVRGPGAKFTVAR